MNLARELDASKFELRLACFKRWGELLEEMETLAIPISVYKINSFYNPQTVRQQLRFAGFLRQNRIQVVHTYGIYSTVFAVPAARLAHVPVVIASIRDIGELLTPFQKRVQKFACRFADSILVNAEAVRQWLIAEGYNAKKIHVIHNGIALDRFEKKDGGATIRQELGLPAHVPLVAMLSRLNRLKGGEYFLQAATALASRFPEVRFLIVGDVGCGDSTYKTALENAAIRLGLGDRVLFAGFRLDIPKILSEVSISVLPSLSEGLSNVLLESMAAGVPVIATKVGGNPEVIEDGVSGLLVPPSDSEALARAMRSLMENPELAHRYGQAGKQRVTEHFSLERMVRQTEQHYLQLLEQTNLSSALNPSRDREGADQKQPRPITEVQP
ncbi:MAG: GT4 family glycosyltransferase PelF [Acidobacteria bacterium]|nr:GT4 family glycosyltransferase PelF [Acidobacteriota bacterium]